MSVFIPVRYSLTGSSLPHWLAFWAVGEQDIPFYPTLRSIIVGFKWSIIDYARKIEDLFAKMEGVRTIVLPPNRKAVDRYFAYTWQAVHSLTAAILSQPSSQPSGSEVPKRFRSYLEAEEARLGNNLKAVDYVIDGVDTLPLIAGVGRIETVRINDAHYPPLNSPKYCRRSFRCCICS